MRSEVPPCKKEGGERERADGAFSLPLFSPQMGLRKEGGRGSGLETEVTPKG